MSKEEIIKQTDYKITLMYSIPKGENYHYLEVVEIEHNGKTYVGIAKSQKEALEKAKVEAMFAEYMMMWGVEVNSEKA